MKNLQGGWSWARLMWATTLIVLPNLALSLLAFFYSLERPYLNVDYALVMLMVALGSRLLGGIVLPFIFFFDILGLVGQVIPILRISDIFYISSFIGFAPVTYQLTILALFILLLLFMVIFLLRKNTLMKAEFLLSINVVVLLYLYSALFMTAEATQVWSNKKQLPVASQSIFALDSRKTGFIESFSAQGDLFGAVPIVGATDPLFVENVRVEKRVLLIVNESWGVMDSSVQDAVLSPILGNPNLLSQVEKGILDFNGVTIEAEIRELCQFDLLHFNFEGHKDELTECLPNRLKAQGYDTFAFHGAAGLMYDRVRWYPDIGFNNTMFFEANSWPRRCYSFPGACDSDMVDFVAKSLDNPGKVFTYWLTLNSHYSYDSRDIHGDLFPCEKYAVPINSETCRNLSLHFQFFQDLYLMLSRPEMAGVRVYVVGDHQPPISDKKEKLRYFKEGKVPWISFKVEKAMGSLANR